MLEAPDYALCGFWFRQNSQHCVHHAIEPPIQNAVFPEIAHLKVVQGIFHKGVGGYKVDELDLADRRAPIPATLP